MIHQVQLKNVGIHQDLCHRFSSGVNVILGNNGSGKSTLIRSIMGSLSGEWGTSKSKMVSFDYSGKDSWAELEFDAADERVTIRSSLVSSAVLFKVGSGEFESVPRKQVDSFVEDRFHCSMDTLNRVAFSNQGDLRIFEHLSPADRQEFFSRTLGLSHFDTIFERLSRFLSKVPVVDISAIEASIVSTKESIIKDRNTLAECVVDEACVEGLRRDLERGKTELEECESQWRAIRQDSSRNVEIDLLESEISSLLENQKTLEDQLSQLSATESKNQSIREMCHRALQQQEEFEINSSRRKSLLSEMANKGRQMNDLIEERSRIGDVKDSKKEQLYLDFLEQQLYQIKGYIEPFQYCPICASQLSEEAISNWRLRFLEDLEKIKDSRNGMGDLVLKEESSRRRLYEINHSLSVLNADIENRTKEFREFQTLSDPGYSIPELQRQLSEVSSRANEVSNLHLQLGMVTRFLTEKRARLSELKARIETTVLSSNSEEDLFNELTRLRKKVCDTTSELQKLESELAIKNRLEDTISSLSKYLTQLEERKASIIVKNQKRDYLQCLQGIFHRECLPAVWLQNRVESLLSHINREFDYFLPGSEVRFNADQFEFEVKTRKEKEFHSLSYLSGGLKSIFGFCIRLALSEVFLSKVDWLILDEPTANLSESSVELLRERLHSFSKQFRRQVIVVTHSKEFARSSDSILQLELSK